MPEAPDQPKRTEDLLNQFRNSFNPRIAVTVDMIATGTDVRPLECVMFMRRVRSRNFFEQMKGRGVRVIDPNDLQAVSADATAKTHFVIVDAVGVTEADFNDTNPLERRKTESLRKLLDQVAAGGRDPDVVSSIAGRLARLDRDPNDWPVVASALALAAAVWTNDNDFLGTCADVDDRDAAGLARPQRRRLIARARDQQVSVSWFEHDGLQLTAANLDPRPLDVTVRSWR